MENSVKRSAEPGYTACIFGGKGYESDVSVKSAARFITEAKASGIKILPIFISKCGKFYICRNDAEESLPSASMIPAEPCFGGFMAEGMFIPLRLAIPLLHGDHGEDGEIQGMLSALGIRYIGADTVCGAACADKIYTKAVASAFGIPTLPHVLLTSDMPDTEILGSVEEIGYPLFIKPCRLGSSIGASAVSGNGDLLVAVRAAFAVSDRIMAEPLLTDKRELECAYFSAGGIDLISAPGQINCTGFYDYGSKYMPGGASVTDVADLDSSIRQSIMDYTAVLAKALSFRHMARVDYFLSGDGEIYLNEINTMPGLTEGSLYPRMLNASGVDFPAFIGALLSEVR